MTGLTDALYPLDTLEGYRRYFYDVAYWQPIVRAVCRQELAIPCHTVRGGLAGTCPTFIVDEQWVIKFYGRLFEGGMAFAVEREVARLLAGHPIPAPALLASGYLDPDAAWPWPYLVFAFLPGVSIGEVYKEVALEDRLAVARLAGQITRLLRDLPLDGSPVFPPHWERYAAFMRGQRAGCKAQHQEWGTLPPHLIEQIEAFLPPVEELIPWGERPYLIHADVTADHVLGRLQDGRWQTTGIIDFGDAMVGSVWYDLAALHLDLFRCDKRMLTAYLDAYGLDPALYRVLPRRAMSAALMHQFDVLAGVVARWPQTGAVPTLDHLAAALWDPSLPGLEAWTER